MRTGTDRLDACPLPVEAVVARLMAWQRPIADLVPGVASCWETHIEVFELLCAALFILRRGSALPPGDCTRRGCQAIVDALIGREAEHECVDAQMVWSKGEGSVKALGPSVKRYAREVGQEIE